MSIGFRCCTSTLKAQGAVILNKLYKCLLSFLGFSSVVVFLWGPPIATAQEVEFSNGYLCASKNPGGEATRLFFRQTDGAAVNLSKTETFPVVCPIVAHYAHFSHSVAVRVGNAHNFTQTVSCALEEYDGGANKARSYGRSKSIPAGFTDSIIWENIRLSSTSTGNYLVIRCILPPLGYITTLGWD